MKQQKKNQCFLSENSQFLEVKSIYLNMRVFVMLWLDRKLVESNYLSK